MSQNVELNVKVVLLRQNALIARFNNEIYLKSAVALKVTLSKMSDASVYNANIYLIQRLQKVMFNL